MLKPKYDGYSAIALGPFADKLRTEYYAKIVTQCASASKQCEKIKRIEKSDSSLEYVLRCEQIIADIEKHVENRQNIYIPYISGLSEKAKDGHDCSTCSGGCKVNHDMHVLELNATNDEMKKVLSRLQMIILPLYSETIYPDEYRLLRSNMTILETQLTELFFLENNYLVPKITEAQKSINAGGK